MSQTAYQVPSLIRGVLSKLPAYPGSILFSGGLNLALKPHLQADTLRHLESRSLRIEVRDAGVAFDFVCKDGSFRAAKHDGEVALTIGASAYDFVQLARRAQDPDTLFFSRRLTMEGDTELGLLVKNSLDAIDLPTLLSGRFAPLAALRRMRPRQQS
ncbi:sterol-binding protein [Trinickia dabaoshanensis]|uniref:Ubiquinone biosynthesis accessory factor UbiT n=1 Tax=Trinickia dabaoshanensis TaxID=564714 RepID=A0A2N7VCI5_9BURK|nr:SCP2 sterol-binding domain-containing protein [Trinickia dabaoshanensis]PMS14888.1 sterol-binding protein [Trinickia dabaoshanensis]